MTSPVLSLPCRLGEYVGLARRLVTPDLVSPEAWQQLQSSIDPMPAVAHEAGLEIRLGAGDPRVDLELCLELAVSERLGLAHAIEESGLASHSRRWRRVRSFLRAWGIEGGCLDEALQGVWLEFDGDGSGTPEPFLILSIDADRIYASGTASPDDVLAPLVSGLDPLADGLDAASQAETTRFVRGLPPSAALRHAAVRPTPQGDIVRLVVSMPWRRVPAVLACAGWPGDPADLTATLERLCADMLVVMLNVDVLPHGLGPRVGIEILHAGAPGGSSRWQRVFDALEALGACAPDRRAAIADWGGNRPGSRVGSGTFCVRRDLLVKAVYEPDRPLTAKAYLAFAPRLVGGDTASDQAAARSRMSKPSAYIAAQE